MRQCAFLPWLMLLATTTRHELLIPVSGSVAPPLDDLDDTKQCTGLMLDFARIQSVTNKDLQALTQLLFPGDISEEGGGINGTNANNTNTNGRSYGVNNVMPVRQQGTMECLLQRHRLQEIKEGVPILGADIVITIQDCAPPDQYAFGGGYEQTPLSGVPLQAISDLDGITFANVEEPNGYVPSKSREEAVLAIANHYDIPLDKVGELFLILFPSTQGDFLSYRSEVLVIRPGGDIQLYDVVVSAHTLEFLSVCKKTSAHNMRLNRRRKLLRGTGATSSQQNDPLLFQSRNLQQPHINCQSCALLLRNNENGNVNGTEEIAWTEEETTCPINSLYLNNTDRTTICVKGTTPSGEQVLGPGTVSELFYEGSYDCMGSESRCVANPFPVNCSDAISDVHYGIIETLKFYQEHLGVMGGLSVNANNPIKFTSFTHYSNQYCNAFFTTQTNNLYFGDCDCGEELWTPLTSLDVVSHELTHGITAFSSSLFYGYQPGGLNEGYSDIMGAVMEYYINDSLDQPDFILGENLNGIILRDMANPTRDGQSIDHVCDFTNILAVHYSSGVLNKAFVSSVQACEASGCSDERGCVLLLGPLFMYANIQKLTQLSGYVDSASKTCGVVEEFYVAKRPTTACSVDEATQFVKDGWAVVGVNLDDTCAGSTPTCVLPTTPPRPLGDDGGQGDDSGGGDGDGDDGGTVPVEEGPGDDDDDCFVFALLKRGFRTTFDLIRRPFSWFGGSEDNDEDDTYSPEVGTSLR